MMLVLCLEVVLLLATTTSVVHGQVCGSGNTNYSVTINTQSPGKSFNTTVCFDGVSTGCTTSSATTDAEGFGVVEDDLVFCPPPLEFASIQVQNDGVDPLPLHYIEVRQNETQNQTYYDVFYDTCFDEPTCGVLPAGTYNETNCEGKPSGVELYEYTTLKEGFYIQFTMDTKTVAESGGGTFSPFPFANQTCGENAGGSTSRRKYLR